MNKIEQLLNELCPDGVGFKTIEELIDKKIISTVTPPKKLTKKDYKDVGVFPIIDQGQDFIVAYTDDENIVLKKGEYVIFGDHTEAIKYIDFAFTQWADWIKILKTNDDIITKYLYYTLNNFYKKTWKYTRHFSFLKKTLIPIPPIEIQKEIVKILDTFTLLEAELEAELEARKKQYEYYRDWIFILNNEIKETNLDDLIISLKTWLNPRKNFVLNTVDAENYYVTVRELWGIDINFYDKTDRVNNEALRLINNRSNLEVWDVLFSWTWTIWRTALVKEKPKNWNIKEGVYVIKPNKIKIDSKFLLFYLNSNQAKKQIENKIVGSPVSSIPMSELKKIKIPVPFKDWEPDLEKQQEIVAILDKFDALVNDISVWLPAELKARRQQYEYYRNKLLDFKVLEK